MTITVNAAVLLTLVLIKQVAVLHLLLLLLMQLLVVTGPVVPVHLIQTEILPMQFILLLRVKLDRQLLLHGMFLIPMAQVLVLLQLIK
jgi:hypothetical protein